jgi:hypothetical protein
MIRLLYPGANLCGEPNGPQSRSQNDSEEKTNFTPGNGDQIPKDKRVKVVPVFLTEHHAMKACGGVEV